MATDTRTATTDTGLRAQIKVRIRAIQLRDVDRGPAHAAPDIVLFDVVDPLRYTPKRPRASLRAAGERRIRRRPTGEGER